MEGQGRMEIIRGRLTAKDVSNPALRYNDGTDQVQFTPDNGVTWVDAPSADPRHSTLYQYPPLTTSDPRCDAAAGMVKWIKDFIDSVIASLNGGAAELAITNDFLTRLTPMFPPALLLLLLQEAATSLFDTGATALDAAFTSTQYDLLLCAFYCHIGSDGTVTPAQLTDVEVQIAATMDSVPAAIVDEILFIQGEVGLTNAGIIGGETGDCTGCECDWCNHQDDTSGFDTWDSNAWPGCGSGATWSGSVWDSADCPPRVSYIWLSKTFSATTITDAALYTSLGTTGSIWINGDGTLFSGTKIWESGSYIGGDHTGVVRLDLVEATVDAGMPDFTLDAAQFSGRSDNPFGTSNC